MKRQILPKFHVGTLFETRFSLYLSLKRQTSFTFPKSDKIIINNCQTYTCLRMKRQILSKIHIGTPLKTKFSLYLTFTRQTSFTFPKTDKIFINNCHIYTGLTLKRQILSKFHIGRLLETTFSLCLSFKR